LQSSPGRLIINSPPGDWLAQTLYTNSKGTAVLTREEAKELVYARINAEDPYAEQALELVIIDDETIEKEYGWVFFYQTKEYLKTGNIVDSLVGNAPYIVNKYTGELIETGTANPIEEYIAEYESESEYGV
jgi:hypothetical protein